MKIPFRIITILSMLSCIVALAPVHATTTNLNTNSLFPEIDVQNVTKPSDASAQVQFLADTDTTLDQPARNDVYAASATVHIQNTVDGDVFAVGNEIIINKQVSGSVRVAGNTVTINSTVRRNTLIFANTVIIGQEANLMGNVRIFASTVTINGTLTGAATIDANTVAGAGRYLTAATLNAQHMNATIHNNDAERVTINHTKPLLHDFPFGTLNQILRIIGIIISALFGCIALFLAFPFVNTVLPELRKKPLALIGRGIIVALVAPCAIILLIITLIGIPFALVGIAALMCAGWFGKVIVAYWIGITLTRTQPRIRPLFVLCGVYLLGYILLHFVCNLPYIGFLFDITATLLGLGVVSLLLKKNYESLNTL